MNLLGASVHAEHDVAPDQYEPNLADENQANSHELGIRMADLNVGMSLGLSFKTEVELRLPLRIFDVTPTFIGESGDTLIDYTSIHHRDETLVGLGDIAVMGRYRLVEPVLERRILVDLRFGLTVPTGSTEADPFTLAEAGESHQHVMFGSGTFDPIVGIESALRLNNAMLIAWAQASASPLENSHGYKAPSKVMGGFSVMSGFGSETWSLNSGIETYHETPATWSGEPAKNSGRTDVIASAGVRYMHSEKWNYNFQMKVPKTVQSLGGQMSTPLIFMVGVGRNTLLGNAHAH
jgi:hypothetical protein